MKKIKEIVEVIADELEGAECYAKKATEYRDTDKALADTYARMAQVELGHVDEMHKHVVRVIEEHRKSGGEVPAAMQAVWDWEHGKAVDNAARVKSLLSVYRGD